MGEYAILGGGGMALEIAELILYEKKKVCGYYAPEENPQLSSRISYLGDERVSFNPNFQYLICSGLVHIREKIINFIESNNLQAGSLISDRAYVSSTVTLGKGTIISPYSSVGSFVHVGDYTFIDGYSSIGHNSKIGRNVVICPGVRVAGDCKIGDNVLIGSNAALIPGTILEDEVEVGILTCPRRVMRKGQFILSVPGRILRED